jgi:hypothetical protein
MGQWSHSLDVRSFLKLRKEMYSPTQLWHIYRQNKGHLEYKIILVFDTDRVIDLIKRVTRHGSALFSITLRQG